MADGVWTLPPMAQGRPLAADNGSAPPLPMMQTAHSRDRSGTVGLEGAWKAQVCDRGETTLEATAPGLKICGLGHGERHGEAREKVAVVLAFGHTL